MLDLLSVLLGQRRRFVNFSNPFSARQWRILLRAEPGTGLRFAEDLRVARARLGFSFRSNRFGLRGPCNPEAPGVILGTSFAMGMSVDDGDNWYDRILEPESWFNGAMPVGPANHAAVLDRFYRGPGKVLVYLYHPNMWRTADGFDRAATEGRSIFEQMNWSTDRKTALKRYPRWVLREIAKWLGGFTLYRRWDRRLFHLNATYFALDPERNIAVIETQLSGRRAIFSRFDRVIVIRTPIKEDCLPEHLATPRLMALRAQYDYLWQRFSTNVQDTEGKVRCMQLDHATFRGEDFHPFDTHWSKSGNARFARLAEQILRDDRVPGLRADRMST